MSENYKGFKDIVNLTEAVEISPITNEHWKLFVSLVSLSALCLLLTIGMYLLIWEKHNCQGWMQFSYLVSLFLFYCVFIPALCPKLTADVNRSVKCFILAVFNQYFFICAKTWLIIISFDLYCTVRKVQIIAKNNTKNLLKFGYYSILGWTIPLIFVVVGVSINLRNTGFLKTQTADKGLWAEVPDYGFLHCRIPNWFIWECFVFTNCLFHVVMLGLICYTICYQRRSIALASSSSNVGRHSALWMTLRLFVVVGISWSYIAVQDFLRAGNINTPQSWGWHVFRCIYFLQGVLISAITVTNGRTIRNLQTKFPKLKGVRVLLISRIRNILPKFCNWKRKGSIESCISGATVNTIT